MCQVPASTGWCVWFLYFLRSWVDGVSLWLYFPRLMRLNVFLKSWCAGFVSSSVKFLFVFCLVFYFLFVLFLLFCRHSLFSLLVFIGYMYCRYLLVYWLSFNLWCPFFTKNYLLRERTQREWAGEGQRERGKERERIPSRLHTFSADPDMGLVPTNRNQDLVA